LWRSAEIAAVARAAEVGGLVPAVAGAGERLDDALEVILHCIGLPLELLAVSMGEARAGFASSS
jgi:hypothetical protein